MQRSKHSDFYYKLQHLNEKISLYKKLFYGKVPSYQKTYMMKKVNEKQVKQKKERETFEKELLTMKINKRKLTRFQSQNEINLTEQSANSSPDEHKPKESSRL